MKKKRLRILVDMDNVIADQTSGFFDMLEEQYPHVPLPPIKSFDPFKAGDAFPSEYQSLVESIRIQEGFFRRLPEIPGAREGLETLQREHDVRIVTAPTWEWVRCVPEKYSWVDEHLGRSWTERLILTRDKTYIQGDVLIDDSMNIQGQCEPTWRHLVFKQPYNQSVNGAIRIAWDVIPAYMAKLSCAESND